MSTIIEGAITAVAAEDKHLAAINDCFVYFLALAETRRDGKPSNLFECLPSNLPKDLDNETANRLREVILNFIENCPQHPNVGVAFRILLDLGAGEDMKLYFVTKLQFYLGQGEAQTVYQLCTVMEDLGFDIFRDVNGAFIMSRAYNEAEMNLGVARRFLERQKATG